MTPTQPPESSAAPELAAGGGWHPRRRRSVILGFLVVAGVLVYVGGLVNVLDDGLAAALILAIGLVCVAWPILDSRAQERPMAPLVALVGCDGSGKTTLAGDLVAESASERPTAMCYLGLGSGTMGQRLKRWPLIGPGIERKLAAKAKQARTRGETIPGLATALIVYAFSLARLRRFRHMLTMRRNGVTVITDRYPQIEVPGFYDGPGLSAATASNRIVAALAARERRMYEWMASFHPDVVIRLNVDADTAFARKPDHKYELLRQKVDATGKLRFSGAPIVDLDSRQPYAEVHRQAQGTLRRTFAAH